MDEDQQRCEIIAVNMHSHLASRKDTNHFVLFPSQQLDASNLSQPLGEPLSTHP